MNALHTQQNIEQALKDFQSGVLAMNAENLLNTLGYESEITMDFESSLAEEFISYFDEFGKLNPERAMVDEWESIDFLFQLTEEEISGSGQTRIAFNNKQLDNTIIESYVFFALKLRESSYTRTQLSNITREINKLMPMPAMIIFQHGQTVTLAVINRRLHKRDESKDVLEKVTLIKDIDSHDPHPAHIKILFDLSRNELFRVHGFSNFVELHRAWAKTLDIQELNKRFYRELSNWYFWAVDNVTFPEDAGEDVDIRNATSIIRLITRLIFVWFIKEKKLVPDTFFNPREIENILVSTDPQESTYYKAILQNLFFATLNQEMNTPEKHRADKKSRGNSFPPDKGGRGVSRKFRGKGRQHYNITSLYRYEEYFANSDEALRHFETIPFLNGGLFECLDKGDKDDPKKILRIDGFSDRADNQLSVPNFLFFAEEKEVDLNKVYDTKGKRYKVRGLIEILRRYKFTITENTPIEEEVALDPELLGKVFENLLAAYNPETGATARKQTGSFYTPREIVNYMVDESLIAHLKSELVTYYESESTFASISPPSQLDLSGQVNPVQTELDTQAALTDKQKFDIEKKLRHLIAYNDEPHRFDVDATEVLIKAIDTLKILDPACGSGAFPMGILHKLVFILGKLDPRNDQWRQRQIAKVENLINMAEGIDDSTVRENTIRDLETEIDNINEAFERNELDYGRKLYLIENCIYGVDIQPVAVQIAKLRFFISLVVDQRIDDTQENRGVRPLPNLETKFVSGNTLISVEKPVQQTLRNPEIDRKETALSEVRRKHFTARTPRTKEKYRDLDKQIRADISQLLKSGGFPIETTEKIANWDPYDQNAVADFFDAEWMFGITDGFHVVIGNPPYVDSENMTKTNPEERQLLAKMYVTTKGNWDLYIPFWELSVNLIHENGSACLITPNKWLAIGYGKALRQYSKSLVYKFVDYSSFRVFESAGVFPVVVFMSNWAHDIIYVERYSDNHHLMSNQNLPADITKQFENWGVLLSDNLDLVVTIMKRGKRLAEFCDAEEAFTVSEAYKLSEYLDEFSSPGHDTFKFINTGTIDPFISLWGTKKTTYLKKKYDKPVVSRECFRKNFEKRYIQTTSPKIIISGIRHFEAFLDANGEWIAGKSTVVLRNFREIQPQLLIGILNSRLVTFFLKECYGSLAMDGGINFSPANVSEIPIPDFHKSKDKCNDIVETVNQIITAKSEGIANDTSNLEKRVNQYVYDLYELTSKEIAVVEAATG